MEQTNREIAEALGKSVSEFRKERANAKDEQQALRRSQVLELRKRGWSIHAIVRILNIGEWTVKSIVKESHGSSHK